MKTLLRFGIFLLLAPVWLGGCGTQPASKERDAPLVSTPPPVAVQADPSPTSIAVAVQSDSMSPAPKNSPSTSTSLRLLTYADSDQTITLRVGESFALELGPSAGSEWLIRVTHPDMLEPPIHELGPEGNRIVLEPVKSGETTISANSHAICEHPGPCPEVFQFFTLKVEVLAH